MVLLCLGKELGEKHINVKELFAIVTAIFAWGKEWRDMSVVLYTDNKPITQISHTGATKNKEMMCLIRYLYYFLAQRNVNIRLEHVYGYNNCKADYLSRLQRPHQPQRKTQHQYHRKYGTS